MSERSFVVIVSENYDVETNDKESKKLDCLLCNKKFSQRSSVLRHLRRAHPVWFSSHKPTIREKKRVDDICGQNSVGPNDKVEHKKTEHKINALRFECYVCDKKYSSKGILNRHLTNFHKVMPNYKNNLQCSECKLSFLSRNSFLDHVGVSHNISVDVQKLHFKDAEEFEEWKSKIESCSSSRFIKTKSYQLWSGNHTVNFICHRNGHYRNTSTGKRRTKISGTNKIEYFCPANIFVKSERSENLFPASVKYCSLHLGHKCEVERIPLAKEEKDYIASQLLSGVPMQHVLHKVTACASPTKRISATNMQDLWNISSSYGIKNHTICKHIHFVDQKLKSCDEEPKDLKELIINVQAVEDEDESEKSPILEELKKNTHKKYQCEARNIILDLLGKLERFNTKEQCHEIIKTITELTHKCEAMEKPSMSTLRV